ncbi:MAG: hypothetical protein K0V04_19955 [Deltaproteobacteria bacterium]|nr:hypothetical protein [Deltaproteobacteria bacterium]
MNTPISLLSGAAVFGGLLAITGCSATSSTTDDLETARQEQLEQGSIPITQDDIGILEPGQSLVLGLEADVVYEVAADVWAEAGDRVMLVGPMAQMRLDDWIVESQELGIEWAPQAVINISGLPTSSGVSADRLSIMEEEGEGSVFQDITITIWWTDCAWGWFFW